MHAPPYREFVAPDTAQVVLIDVADEALLRDFHWFINPDGYVVLNVGRYRDELAAAHAAEACRRVHFPFATPEPFENVGPCRCLDCR